jgi:hypothetical protein
MARVSPTVITTLSQSLLLIYVSPVSNTGLQIILFLHFSLENYFNNHRSHHGTWNQHYLLEAIQREEVMNKQWDCKLIMFKEEAGGPEINLLD